MINGIKGAIFDMDGTLVNSLMLWNVNWKKFGDIYCGGKSFAPTPEDDKALRTMTLKDAMYFVHSKYNIGNSGEELFEMSTRIFKDFYSKEVKLKEGVAEFLEYCHNKGIKMCIASASELKLVKLAVEHCNIGKYFENIISCVDIGKGKEEPDVYIKALECLGTEKEETCLFEDSHVAIETGIKLGLKTVGIYDKYNYGQDKMKKIASAYIADGETLMKLADKDC